MEPSFTAGSSFFFSSTIMTVLYTMGSFLEHSVSIYQSRSNDTAVIMILYNGRLFGKMKYISWMSGGWGELTVYSLFLGAAHEEPSNNYRDICADLKVRLPL